MSMNYIREYYCVPAKKGMRVKVYGKNGIIIGSKGAHLRIRIDGEKHSGIYHPTDGLEYIEPGCWNDFDTKWD